MMLYSKWSSTGRGMADTFMDGSIIPARIPGAVSYDSDSLYFNKIIQEKDNADKHD